MSALADQFGLTEEQREFFDFRDVSLLDLASQQISDQGQVAFLNEHFRSEPEIIEFSNREFYAGKLQVMTNCRNLNAESPQPLELTPISGAREANGANPAEVAAVTETIAATAAAQADLKPNLVHSIGIVSPFTDHVEALKKAFLEMPNHHAILQRHDVLIGTVHSFQGEERDIMLVTLALDDKSPSASYRFLDRADVFNVMVTRARLRNHVFHSFTPSRVRPDSLLARFIGYAETGASVNPTRSDGDTNLCKFADEVAAALREVGAEVHVGFPLAGMTVDIVYTLRRRDPWRRSDWLPWFLCRIVRPRTRSGSPPRRVAHRPDAVFGLAGAERRMPRLAQEGKFQMISTTRYLIVVLCLAGAAHAQTKPNIVFILADDLGWADTTLYEQTEFYETPNLKRLAKRGMTFNRAYTASPLCSPTRSSILTGLHPARTGLTTPNCHTPLVRLKASVPESAAADRVRLEVNPVTRLDPKYLTLSESLQSAGYSTAHFGKWHLGAEPYSPLEHGFDVDIPHWHGPGPAGSYVAPWRFPNFKEAYPGEHVEDRMGDEIVSYLKARKDDGEPFFVNYWQFSVHAPFNAKADLIEKHRARINPDDAQRSPTYAAMIESLDDNVGKVLDTIDELGFAENTIIIFFSDNGGNMYNEVDGTTPTANRPLRGGKGNNWDGGVRVPAVVVWPGEVEAGARSDELITSTDFYPTLLEMLGMKSEQRFDGVSIVPALRGRPLERDAIFTFFPHSTKVPDTLPPSTAIYQGDWKLFRLFNTGEAGEHTYRLFNLAEDIGEQQDLAPQHPERITAMRERLDAFLEDTKAVVPRLNPRWNPALARLSKLGWSSLKSCELRLEDGLLVATCAGGDPHFRFRPEAALPAGSYLVRTRVKRTNSGSIELRWEEAGMKPPYHADRLVRADAPTGEWANLEFRFDAANPVASIRTGPW